jgi:UDP-2,3-diacylglucosamine pyrophosphatase LpxH
MIQHTLSVYPEEYEDLKTGRRRFIIVPRNDDYKVGDFITIHEIDRQTKQKCRSLWTNIIAIQENPVMFVGNPDLWVILFIKFKQIIYTDRP